MFHFYILLTYLLKHDLMLHMGLQKCYNNVNSGQSSVIQYQM